MLYKYPKCPRCGSAALEVIYCSYDPGQQFKCLQCFSFITLEQRVMWHVVSCTNPAPQARDASGLGTVYIVTDGHAVKIGFTSKTVKERVAQLQTGNPRPITVLSAFSGTIADEQRIHAALSENNVSGEWFAIPRYMDVHDIIALKHGDTTGHDLFFDESDPGFFDESKLAK